ncbi:MAG: hypothetical protein V4672_12270 [Verrucomicrobiota bacterium]
MKAGLFPAGKKHRPGRIKLGRLAILAGLALLVVLGLRVYSHYAARHAEYKSLAFVIAFSQPVSHEAVSGTHPLPDPFVTWIIQTLNSSSFNQQVAQKLRAIRPDLTPTTIKITVQPSRQAAVWCVWAMGQEANYTQAYLEAVLDELVKVRIESPIVGNLRIGERATLAIKDEPRSLGEIVAGWISERRHRAANLR